MTSGGGTTLCLQASSIVCIQAPRQSLGRRRGSHCLSKVWKSLS